MDQEPALDRSSVVEERLANISLTESTEKGKPKMKEEHDGADREKFMSLVKKSRQLAERGDIARALELNRQALAIHYSDKLEKRIQKMEAFLSQLDEDSDGENKEDMEDLGLGFKLHCSMAGRLYTHQKEGVLWLWSLYRKGKGGILADDMGLGKTIQVIAFLAGMFDMDKIKTVMIVVPLSVMPNWETEFAKWTPGITVTQFHGSSKKDRERALHKVRSRGGVMLTTYGLIITQQEALGERFGREFVWDYIILDEGHKIKNKTKTSKGMNEIPAKNRIILTGTPVQNNLKELWALFDYVHQGSLLGTVRTFKMQFETPITRARERDASAVHKRLGQEMSDALKKIIQPYFLRRTKRDVAQQGEETLDENCAKMPELTRKNDIVLWVHLNELQQKIYRDFLDLDQVKALLMTKKSPLVALTVLKKICDHPRLLSTRACMQLGLDGDDFDEEDLERAPMDECAANKIDNIPDDVLVGEAGKMGILIELLDNFRIEGHKTLVFSQSRKLLDMIQRVITNRGHKVARLDGTISSLEERKDIVDQFQRNPSYSVFLLTIQVGGVGLTITAADRVIIYDPSWNPAVDAQAVDRAYRIGQTENVVVHRLISCATVEEKIYRRQVFKDSITRQTTGNSKNPYRYFTQMELRELFTLDDPRDSKTQRQLQEMHANQRVTDESLDAHIAFLHSLDIFGISDHDLMFNDIHNRDDEEDEEENSNPFIGRQEHNNNEDFIQYRIQQAQMLIAAESNNVLPYDQRVAGHVRTFEGNNRVRDAGIQDQPPSNLFSEVAPIPVEQELVNLLDDDGNNAETEDDDDEVQVVNHRNNPTPEPIHIIDSDEETEDIRPHIKQEIFSYKEKENLSNHHRLDQQTNDKANESENIDKDTQLASSHEPRERDDSVIDSHSAHNISKSDEEDSDQSMEMFQDEAENADVKSDEASSDLSSEGEIEKKSNTSLSIFRNEESRSELHKRALQPLTQSDLDKRSPLVMKDGKPIVTEEIMISPDCNQPLIGLTASSKKSVGKSTTPLKPSSCRKLQLSAAANSQQKIMDTSSSSIVDCSPQAKTRINLNRTFFQSMSTPPKETSTPSGPEGCNVLVTDSPDSSPEVAPRNARASRRIIADSDDESGGNGPEGSSEKSDPVIIGESDDDEKNPVQGDEEEDVAGEEADEENERFQELVMIARALYKKKDYLESLHYTEEALTIFHEPDLETMADRIREKLRQQQE